MNLKDCLVHALYKNLLGSLVYAKYRTYSTGLIQVYVHDHVCDCYCVDFTADTEGSFIVERVVDIADAAVKHMQHVVQSADMDETGTIS